MRAFNVCQINPNIQQDHTFGFIIEHTLRFGAFGNPIQRVYKPRLLPFAFAAYPAGLGKPMWVYNNTRPDLGVQPLTWKY